MLRDRRHHDILGIRQHLADGRVLAEDTRGNINPIWTVATAEVDGRALVLTGSDGGDDDDDDDDTLVDPANGCNIAEEYTNLSIWVTNDCGQNVSTDPSTMWHTTGYRATKTG